MPNWLERCSRICSAEASFPSASSARRLASPNDIAGFAGCLRPPRAARPRRAGAAGVGVATPDRARLPRRDVSNAGARGYPGPFLIDWPWGAALKPLEVEPGNRQLVIM